MNKLNLPVVHTRVFGATLEGGNPCPVVLNADHLAVEQMQSLAAHFKSETAFVLTPKHHNSDFCLRYFVPQHEMEMCIHATVGTITALISRQILTRSPIQFDTPLGTISATWESDEKGLHVAVEQFPPIFIEKNPSRAEVSNVLRIPETAIDLEVGPIQSVSTSRPKLMVPICDRTVLDDMQPDFEQLWSLCDQYQTTGLYPFTTQTPKLAHLSVLARQFPKRAGYNEDPATGVAACALGAYLTEYAIKGKKLDGWHTFQVGQGYAMGCPSIIQAESFVEEGRIVRTRIRGQAIIISDEAISVDQLKGNSLC